MLVIHKSWCGACKKLKSIFAEDQEVNLFFWCLDDDDNNEWIDDRRSFKQDLIHAQCYVVSYPTRTTWIISFLLQILDLSAKFVMVNAGDDDEPSEEVYKPDGGYIPRWYAC